MRNVMIIVVLLSLVAVAAMADPPVIEPTKNAGDPASPFGASLGVDISVAPWASVEWDKASMAIQLQGPKAGWVRNTSEEGEPNGNWDMVPLHVKSNTDITVMVYEDLGKFVIDNGIPAEGVWGQGNIGTAYGKLIYAPGLQLWNKDRSETNHAGDGPCYDQANDIAATLPEAVDIDSCSTGGMGRVWLNYAGHFATGPVGPSDMNIGPSGYHEVPINGGNLTVYTAIGIRTHDGVFEVEGEGDDDGVVYNWTNLGSELTDSAKIWAVVVPGLDEYAPESGG